jgi:hypothetical protein
MNAAKNMLTRFIATFLLAALVVLALSGKSDNLAEDYIDESFKRALVTFALARGMNALISVVQGTELAFEPAGIGVTLTPGEVLDPINDLIERFSWVMLLATTSLGTQEVLTVASRASALQAALLIAVAVGMLLTWRPEWTPSVAWRGFLLRFVALALFVRFAVPGIALLNHITYETFLSERYEESLAALENAKKDLEAEQARTSATGQKDNQAPSKDAENGGGWFDGLFNWYERKKAELDVKERLANLQETASEATEQVVNLIVVFVLTTIVFPLLFLFLGLRIVRIIGQVRWWKEN